MKKISDGMNSKVKAKLEEIAGKENANRNTNPNTHPIRNFIKNNGKGIYIFITSVIAILGLMLGMSIADNGAVPVVKQTRVEYADEAENANELKSSKTKTSSTAKSKTKSSSKSKSSKQSKEQSGEESTSSDSPYNPGGNDKGNTAANIINGGFLSFQDGYIYYKGQGLLVKEDVNTKEAVDLIEKEVNSINVLGDRIYLQMDGYDNMVVEVDMDGDVDRAISIGCGYITAYNDYMVTADSYGIYRYDIEGNNKSKLYNGDIDKCTDYEGDIYFIEGGTLKVIDEVSGNVNEIAQGVESYSIGEDGLYYISGGEVYRDGEKEGINAISINVSDGIIYYGNTDDGGSLYQKDIYSEEIGKVSDIRAEAICVGEGVIAVESGGTVMLIE